MAGAVNPQRAEMAPMAGPQMSPRLKAIPTNPIPAERVLGGVISAIYA